MPVTGAPSPTHTRQTRSAMLAAMDMHALADNVKRWGSELGFQQIGITDTQLDLAETRLKDWLARGYQADMDWMSHHGDKRTRPALLEPGTFRVISARMNYLPDGADGIEVLGDNSRAYIARYALGRDYHKLMRKRLAQLATQIRAAVAETQLARAFVDSAPVMEKPLAEKAGLGWQGKHTLLINRAAGSWFFLGEIYTDLALPTDEPVSSHCGSCRACMDVCPTDAIVAPYQLDAGRCIAYLTIEHKGVIEEALRPLIGNRVFGCDDCQLFCPWNRYARPTGEGDFQPRHSLDNSDLLSLFSWTEAEFLERTAGSAIRRSGYDGWQRNLAIALGNGPFSSAAVDALQQRLASSSDMVAEHIHWALTQLNQRAIPD